MIIIPYKYAIFHTIIKYYLKTYTLPNEEALIINFANEHYSAPCPTRYHYKVVSNNQAYTIFKYIKIICIVISFICLCLLAVQLFYSISFTVPIAGINFFSMLVEVGILFTEKIWLRWDESLNWFEIVMIVVSIPGTFLLWIPRMKFSTGTIGMQILLRILYFFSGFRLLRLPSLLINRNSRRCSWVSLR